jgi:starch synthase
MKKLKILFVSSEVTPLAKTGGLADVSAALPQSLVEMGHDVKVVMPLYRSVAQGDFRLEQSDVTFEVPLEGQKSKGSVFSTQLGARLPVYFVDNSTFFDREGLYGTPKGDHPDNAERFIFFSRAALELSRGIGFQPDIVHCNDWQTGLIPVYLNTLYKEDPHFAQARTVFTVHNLAYQGVFPKETMELSGLPESLFSIDGLEFYGRMNFMKGGILFSDVVSTVSRKYSQEIQTQEFGHGLEGVLRNRRSDLFGVLNGVDYKEWSPENDPHLAAPYSVQNLAGKKECKKDVQQLYQLAEGKRIPLIGMISRLAGQKGFDILLEALDDIFRLDVQFILLGTGDEIYEKEFEKMASKHKKKMSVKIAFDNALAHKIEAGADMFLMPSRYEPCGLNQMYSLKYGTIPIVRATGGLDDTIMNFDVNSLKGNGFKFEDYSAAALIETVRRALKVYQDEAIWLQLKKNAMSEDFSWEQSAEKYTQLYSLALNR